jgi:hypothetical protein
MNQQTRECLVERVLESFIFFDNLRFVNVSGFEISAAHIVVLNKVYWYLVLNPGFECHLIQRNMSSTILTIWSM